MKLLTLLAVLIISEVTLAETIQIEFTEDDSYSIEVAHINIGDRIDWLPNRIVKIFQRSYLFTSMFCMNMKL